MVDVTKVTAEQEFIIAYDFRNDILRLTKGEIIEETTE